MKLAKPDSKLFAEASARGLALFFGLFSLANSIASLAGRGGGANIWWIDLSALPAWLGGAFLLVAGALYVAWGTAPGRSRLLDRAASVAGVLLALAACANSLAFYRAWGAHTIAPALPVPASLLYAAAFAWLAHRAWHGAAPASASGRVRWMGAIAALVVFIVVFPVVQMAFFGSTDYRRPADAAVVLGALVYPNGTVSTALGDRVRTAADLYKSGLVSRLIMSGAVGVSGVDETVAMQKMAVQLGVPASAILRDNQGVNTDATVADTVAMFDSLRTRRVLAVSQFWHLPRIKLAYRAAGWDVQTVPAGFSQVIWQTPYLMAREVPAFWQYWARSIARR